jgi:hypothetical protein
MNQTIASTRLKLEQYLDSLQDGKFCQDWNGEVLIGYLIIRKYRITLPISTVSS